jgi:hypothetical protein
MKQLVALGAMTLLLTACSANRTIEGAWLPGTELIPGASVLILPVGDGIERSDGPASGSGAAVTSSIRNQLIEHGFSPRVAESTRLSSALSEAEKLDFTYVLKGVLTEWEDNATEWSGKPDRAALSLELYEVQSERMVASSQYRIKGSVVSQFSQPDRFVPELVDNALGRIFNWTPTPV